MKHACSLVAFHVLHHSLHLVFFWRADIQSIWKFVWRVNALTGALLSPEILRINRREELMSFTPGIR